MNTPKNLGMRRFLRDNRALLYFVAFLLSVYVFEWGVMGLIYFFVGALPDEWSEPRSLNVIIPLGLAFWALLRVHGRSPVTNGGYRNWLTTVPWTPARELPFGSILLGWSDVPVFGAAMLAWTGSVHSVYMLLAFFAPYCLLVTISNFLTKEYNAVYAAVAVASCLPLVLANPWLTLVVMLGTYVCCRWGFLASLQRFPWDASVDRKFLETEHSIACDTWPLVNRGGLKDTVPLIPWKHVFVISLLSAWIAAEASYFLIRDLSVRQQIGLDSSVWSVLILIVCFVSAVRFTTYWSNRASPIGILGRITTGRFIIPSYDKIWLFPLLIFVLGSGMSYILIGADIPVPVVVFTTVFTVLALGMGMGPTVPEWNFTGNYRMLCSGSGVDIKRSKT